LTFPLEPKRDPQLSRSALKLASRFALTTTFVPFPHTSAHLYAEPSELLAMRSFLISALIKILPEHLTSTAVAFILAGC